ncbi:Hint domain-containing protein [Shimia sp. R9_2]|uniref:Hint domain-containing protein n=1 Tax=Shimia sp. R9_2 TaxID=2821112 RepID=UPI001AD97131|nr:Hint domain-containing protein [Shimia sp. R9_2]MBO9397380.1 Hint domain-containing protein [Shimia sp. R9_2]
MSTTFNALSIGQLAEIDTFEGNSFAENASALVGLTFGGPGAALLNNFVEVSATGGVGAFYAMNNNPNDRFRIDGGAPQQFDGVAVYNATITYLDGSTATYSAVLFQDVDGNSYLAPELTNNTDQATLEAGPIQSISLDSLAADRVRGLAANRQEWDFVPCFAAGTPIVTQQGERAIETLQAGDMILTLDHGFQPLRWIGQRTVAAQGAVAPVRFAAGALGNDVPLMVSPHHRMMLRGWRVEMHFGEAEALVPAISLVNGDTICQVEGGEITYVHLMFDCHEIVYGGGVPSESFLPGAQGLNALERSVQEEIFALFPELRDGGLQAYGAEARPALRVQEARLLVA